MTREGRSRLEISGVSEYMFGISRQKEKPATPADPEMDWWALKVHKIKRFVRKEDRKEQLPRREVLQAFRPDLQLL